MAEKLLVSGKKRLFIRYVSPKISSDMENVYNAIREQNTIVLINTKRLRRLDCMMLKRVLVTLKRVAEASNRLLFTIEQDMYMSIPKATKAFSHEISAEDKGMLEEFEKISMNEELEDKKKKQAGYAKKFENFLKKRGEDKELLDFEIKSSGTKVKEILLSIKSPFSAEDVGSRMDELIELKNLVSGHMPQKMKNRISENVGALKQEEEVLRDAFMKQRRRLFKKLEAVNDLVESKQISKKLFLKIKKELNEELNEISGMVVRVGKKDVKVSIKKTGHKKKRQGKK